MGKHGIQPNIQVDKTYTLPPPTGDTARDIIAFAESLPVISGLRQGELIELMPFQQEIIRAISKDNIREAIISVPRKQGKTTLASVLCLYYLTRSGERMGEVYSVANNREQAAIIFRMLEQLIYHVPSLLQECNIRRFTKEIEHNPSGSFFKSLASDSTTLHGLNPTFCVVDEAGQSKNRLVYDAVKTAGGARQSSKIITISTQAADDEHWFSKLLDYAASDDCDNSVYCYQLSAPETADIHDRDTWLSVNPAITGGFRGIADIEAGSKQAQAIPSTEGMFRNLYLNQRVSIQYQQGFLSKELWQQCFDSFGEDDLQGKECVIGLDLASVSDLVGVVCYFPATGHVLPYSFVPAETIKNDKTKLYSTWVKLGHLKRTAGLAIDREAVVEFIQGLHKRYQVLAVSADRWGTREILALCNKLGYDFNLQPYGQGYKDQTPAISGTERLVLQGRLKHNNHPVLNWCLSNLVIERDASGNKKPSKKRAGDKIDLASALFNAVGYCVLNDLTGGELTESPFGSGLFL